MSVSDDNKNRGAHGDSSFMLGGVPSSSENPTAFMRLGCQWRFGQLMSNILGEYYSQTKMDPFFPEDDEMIQYIEKYLGVDTEKKHAT